MVTGDLKCLVSGWQITWHSSGVFLDELPCQLIFHVTQLAIKEYNVEDQILYVFLQIKHSNTG
jgi:hypothetical protein